jgi:hypothetical protein
MPDLQKNVPDNPPYPPASAPSRVRARSPGRDRDRPRGALNRAPAPLVAFGDPLTAPARGAILAVSGKGRQGGPLLAAKLRSARSNKGLVPKRLTENGKFPVIVAR